MSPRILSPLLLALVLVAAGCTNVSKLDLSNVGSRAMWQRPDDVVRALGIESGDVVADLGAGDGYFEPYLAEAVGAGGRVYAVEVDPGAVAGLDASIEAGNLENVEVVVGLPEDPNLPDREVDVVLLVNSYHHIDERPAYFRRLRADLAPGGQVAIIEPNEDLGGVLSLFLDEGHTSRAGDVHAEMAEAGYRSASSPDVLPVQIFEVFEVPSP